MLDFILGVVATLVFEITLLGIYAYKLYGGKK